MQKLAYLEQESNLPPNVRLASVQAGRARCGRHKNTVPKVYEALAWLDFKKSPLDHNESVEGVSIWLVALGK